MPPRFYAARPAANDLSHFPGRQETVFPQPLVTGLDLIGPPKMVDDTESESRPAAGAPSFLIEDLSNLPFGVIG